MDVPYGPYNLDVSTSKVNRNFGVLIYWSDMVRIEKGGNYRPSEAKDYADKYIVALKTHLPIGEDFAVTIDYDDNRQSMELIFEPKDEEMNNARMAGHTAALRAAFPEAHARALAEIGAPELHGPDGKPLQGPKFENGGKSGNWVETLP